MTRRSNIVLKKEEEDIEVVEGEIIDDNIDSSIELKKKTEIQPLTFLKTIGKIGSLILMVLETGNVLKNFSEDKTKKNRRRKRRKNENIPTGKRRQRN